MTEYEILFPKGEKYKGVVHLAALNKAKEIKSLGFCFFEDLPKRIENFEVRKNINYYITANTTKPFTTRKNDNLFALNNIVIDCDIHTKMNQYERTEILQKFVWYLKRDVFGDDKRFQIPEPNIIHYTGRGVQLWWHIEQTSSKLLFLYKKVIDNITYIIRDFLMEYPELEETIDIDLNASKNPTGLFRLFSTYNTHTQTKTETEILRTDGLNLNDINSLLCSTKQIQKYTDFKKAEYLKNQSKLKVKKSYAKGYTNLHKKRVALIKFLANERAENIGERDTMLYLAFNAAIQFLTREEAEQVCNDINTSFDVPLNKIDYIFKELKNPHKITNKYFYEQLEITDTEKVHFETEHRKATVNMARNEQAAKNKQIRAEKQQQAINLISQGKHTQKEIADIVGLSTSTISKISKTVPKPTKSKKIWEELGVSRATYYRKK